MQQLAVVTHEMNWRALRLHARYVVTVQPLEGAPQQWQQARYTAAYGSFASCVAYIESLVKGTELTTVS
jgi:hypothetical protein